MLVQSISNALEYCNHPNLVRISANEIYILYAVCIQPQKSHTKKHQQQYTINSIAYHLITQRNRQSHTLFSFFFISLFFFSLSSSASSLSSLSFFSHFFFHLKKAEFPLYPRCLPNPVKRILSTDVAVNSSYVGMTNKSFFVGAVILLLFKLTECYFHGVHSRTKGERPGTCK